MWFDYIAVIIISLWSVYLGRVTKNQRKEIEDLKQDRDLYYEAMNRERRSKKCMDAKDKEELEFYRETDRQRKEVIEFMARNKMI